MSLEQIIKDNTAALLGLTAALSTRRSPAAVTPPAESKAQATPPTTPPPAAASGAVTYDVVAKVVSDFVKANGRAPAVILLEPFKVTTLVPLKDKPTELAGVYAAFTDPVRLAAAIAAVAKPA